MTGRIGLTDSVPHELARVAVQLLIYSENLSPETVAARLNLQPTRSSKKGVKVGARTGTPVTVPNHLWELSSEFQLAARDVPSHLEWLLSKLQPIREQLRTLRDDPEIRCKLIAVIWAGGDIAYVQLATKHMEVLLDLQLDLQLEFADYGEDE